MVFQYFLLVIVTYVHSVCYEPLSKQRAHQRSLVHHCKRTWNLRYPHNCLLHRNIPTLHRNLSLLHKGACQSMKSLQQHLLLKGVFPQLAAMTDRTAQRASSALCRHPFVQLSLSPLPQGHRDNESSLGFSSTAAYL